MPTTPPLNTFSYNSVQTHIVYKDNKPQRKTRKVQITNGKGFKETVTSNGRQTRRSRKALTKKEISCIRRCQFIPGLFKSCDKCVGM